jgi:cytosolic carboxypeptidase protein 5
LTGDDKKTLQITFEYNFKFEDEQGVLFSFCYPWSYQKNQKFLECIESNFSKNMDLYYNREILSYSKEKRRLDLITISSTDNITNVRETLLKGLFPTNNKFSRPFAFSKEKPIIFISARVHPGETPASYLMNGIIKFLVDKSDPRAKILRKYFVFKIIPIINVDGVSRGFYRYDTNSLNMNRHYPNPNQKIQPEIYAIRRLFLFYSQEYKVRYYYDLHAHVQSKGLFLFGNSLDFLFQVENCLLPKLIEINCEYLNFDNCILTEKCMKSKERGDKNSKEGTGRVHFNKCTGIIHSYTIEASYFRGINKNEIPEINLEDRLPDEKFQFDLKQIINNCIDFDANSDFIENRLRYKQVSNSNLFTPVEYEKMGFSLLIAILDYEELNPYSRVFKSEYSHVSNVRKFISNKILKEDDKYRNNVLNQNLNKDICAVKKFVPLFEKFINHLNNLIVKKSLKLLSKDSMRHNTKEIYDFRKKLLTSRKINSDNNLISTKDKVNFYGEEKKKKSRHTHLLIALEIFIILLEKKLKLMKMKDY